MMLKKNKVLKSFLVVLLLSCLSYIRPLVEEVPKLWTSENLKDLYIPLADSTVSIINLPDSIYYGLKEQTIYKTYPFYFIGMEPEGYYEKLAQLESEIIFEPSQLKTEQDWIKAGELIYDYPGPGRVFPMPPLTDTLFRKSMIEARENYLASGGGVLGIESGIDPTRRIVIREKGKIEVGSFACAMCHTKYMPDGSQYKGAQGNYSFDDAFGERMSSQLLNPNVSDSIKKGMRRRMVGGLLSAPWIEGGRQQKMWEITNEEFVKSFTNTYGGVMHRHGTVVGSPTSIPDLYNIKERKYLDHTGLIRHNKIEDLMLYATLNEQVDRYDKYIKNEESFSRSPLPSEGGRETERFSDEQLYALAKYLYSLEAPKSPYVESQVLVSKGEEIFNEQSCVTCHTPPLYSNYSLTPVDEFEVPDSHLKKYNIFNISVETDPVLALESRRGTGYYKVPSLIGVWNRQALLHSGNIRTLDELFNQNRLNDDYIPNGYQPGWLETYPVKGHPFGLDLNTEDKSALIVFLRSL